MKTRVVLAFAPSLVGLFLLNCSDPDLCEGPQCAVATDGGGDGGGDATLGDGGKTDGAPLGDGGPGKDGTADGSDGTSPVSCNTAADVSSQPACVADAYAVFVNGMTGSDSAGNGTKENAFKSIGKAIGASSSGGRVFICATTYDEKVVLSANVSLYGGFNCSSWTYSTTNVPKVAPSAAGYALDLESVAGVTIEDLEFDSVAGVNPGDSSVAVFAANAMSATFVRAVVKAGNAGAQPAKPSPSANYVTGNTASNGVASTGTGFVPAQNCLPACLLSHTASIGGYSGAASGSGGDPGGDGGPAVSGTTGGAGGVPGSCTGVGTGTQGASTPAATGGAGATTFGALTATSWTPSSGEGGSTAAVAQGGGGGAGGSASAGGGGGCGGCGGGGGAPGAGGGSSFAVLSYESALSFVSCTLIASNPGTGGDGADGQVGEQGGLAGGTSIVSGCPGGAGGNGGNGGGGGGGAAGLSVDVGYVGQQPTISTDSMTTFVASAAAPGAAGANGAPAATGGRVGANGASLDLSK